jgi:CheY-like chemotaxis protein
MANDILLLLSIGPPHRGSSGETDGRYDLGGKRVINQGSRFHFTGTPVVRVDAQNTTNPFRHGTILLAEDNYINQVVTVRILEGQGHRVVVAANGRLALEILRRQVVDLVLMDIQMPEMDGFQTTKAIREEEANTGPHVPIIALTAHALHGTVKNAWTRGWMSTSRSPSPARTCWNLSIVRWSAYQATPEVSPLSQLHVIQGH